MTPSVFIPPMDGDSFITNGSPTKRGTIYGIKKGHPPIYLFYADLQRANYYLNALLFDGLTTVLNHYPCGFAVIINNLQSKSKTFMDRSLLRCGGN